MTTFRIQKASELSASESASLRVLGEEAFKPQDEIDRQSREKEWAPPQIHIAGWDNNEAVCHVGVTLRTGTLNGIEVAIGGIGGVATLRRFQRQGLASKGLELANDVLKEHSLDFGLLVCRDRMIPFYGQRGWSLYTDPVSITQRGQTMPFSVVSVMVCSLGYAPAIEGTIDLKGPPW